VTTQSLFSEPQELLPFDGSAVLQPRFFDVQRSVQLFESLMQQTAWEQPEMIIFGKKHAQAGLSTWYSDTGVNYEYSGVVRCAHPMTSLLDRVRVELEKFTGVAFNSVLVNLYRDGKDSVSWHSDNEAVNGIEPDRKSVV
jgi:alkylated DNA repair dioxygenase AlkB